MESDQHLHRKAVRNSAAVPSFQRERDTGSENSHIPVRFCEKALRLQDVRIIIFFALQSIQTLMNMRYNVNKYILNMCKENAAGIMEGTGWRLFQENRFF